MKQRTQAQHECTYYDLLEGRVIVGENIETLIEAGVHPADIVSLEKVINSNELVDIDAYPKLDCKDWTPEDYKHFGQWVNTFVENGSVTATPTRSMYHQVYRLGLGPEVGQIIRRFESLWNFHDALELQGGYCRGKYDNWSFQDFMEY